MIAKELRYFWRKIYLLLHPSHTCQSLTVLTLVFSVRYILFLKVFMLFTTTTIPVFERLEYETKCKINKETKASLSSPRISASLTPYICFLSGLCTISKYLCIIHLQCFAYVWDKTAVWIQVQRKERNNISPSSHIWSCQSCQTHPLLPFSCGPG